MGGLFNGSLGQDVTEKGPFGLAELVLLVRPRCVEASTQMELCGDEGVTVTDARQDGLSRGDQRKWSDAAAAG